MKNNLSLLLLLVIIIFVIAISGCKKCICCATTYGRLICIENNDSVAVVISGGPRHSIYDSINYYQNRGFTVIVSDTAQEPPYNATCGRLAVKDIEALGNICIPPVNEYNDCY